MSAKRAPDAIPARPIPVCRPWAPPAEALLPYLKRIDEARWYSNFGPLARTFETRLAERFKGDAHIVSIANGTLALALALRARAPNGGLCVMPAWTFVATAHAAILAGLTPYFVDVEDEHGALTPDIARRAISKAPARVGAATPVAPFGLARDLDAWAHFESDTGVPVVLDGAAAFDAVDDAATPLIVSLHATKTLGVGEGAFFATRDGALAAKVRALSVFGFEGSRLSRMPAFNAKLSEYAAAVGLAALDCWPETRRRLMRTAQLVRAAFTRTPSVQFQSGWGIDWISSTCVARVDSADRLARRLESQGIETRRWWDRGLHRQPAFRGTACANGLAVTNRLAATMLGLPYSIDLEAEEIDRIALAVTAAGA